MADFNYIFPDDRSGVTVARLIDFACGISGAWSGVFFWVGAGCEMFDPQMRNYPQHQYDRYLANVGVADPIHIRWLSEGRRKVVILSDEERQCIVAPREYRDYRDYLNSAGISDEADLIFWSGTQAIACLTLMQPTGGPGFSMEKLDWEAMRSFMECSLATHWRVRSLRARRALADDMGLKPRELEVVKFILLGKSNREIAEILNISVATVKTHVVSILNKMGADNRASIVAIVGRL